MIRGLIVIVRTDCTHPTTILQVHISKEYLQLEPIGLVFVFFFALILIIQFTAMMFHRFGTISHILSSTDLGCSKKTDELSQDALIDKVRSHQHSTIHLITILTNRFPISTRWRS